MTATDTDPPPYQATDAAAEDPGVNDTDFPSFSPDDTVIAVMGVTGVGKSTFISHFNHNAEIGAGLQSQTSTVETHEAKIGGRKVYLVDTPGFDDTHISDIDVLRMLADWLNRTHQAKVRLAGIVYLHRIGDTRLGGSAMKNLRMFRKLCGDEALSCVVLATTMWGMVPTDIAEQREHQLVTNPEFWAGMIQKGSKVFRQDSDEQSARRIVEYLLAQRRPTTLKIQKEMASGKTLDETGAGLEVEAEKEKLRAKHKDEMRKVQEEWQEAQKARDVEAQKELTALKADLEAKMKKEQEDRERMRVSLEQLQKERNSEVVRERENAHARELSYIKQLTQQEADLDKMRTVGGLQKKLAVAELQRKLAVARTKAARLEARNAKLRKNVRKRS